MAAPDASPKLQASTTGNTEGYAPISWTAVASLAVAALFVVTTVLLMLYSFFMKQSLIEPRLLVFPAVAVVLAFIARRQISASEGTRTGLRYANAGWTVAVVGGLIYATYLLAIEFAIRNDANREFTNFTNNLKELNPGDPADPKLYAAMFELIPPGARASVAGPTDATGIDSSFQSLSLGFRSMDVIRIASRTPGEVTFEPTGLVDWLQKPREITCTIKAVMKTPEGEFDLVVPMQAEVEDNGQRRWMIVPSFEGYVKGRRLTPYGWMVEGFEQSGKKFVTELINTLATQGNADAALMAFVLPGGDAGQVNRLMAAVTASEKGRLALAGAGGIWPPVPPGLQTALATLFAKPNGKPPTSDESRDFRNVWTNPRRLTSTGTTLKSNPDSGTLVKLQGDKVVVSVPAEIVLNYESQPPPAARARVLIGLQAPAETATLAELARLKSAAGPATETPPAEIYDKISKLPWRVTRVVSDLTPVAVGRTATDGPEGAPAGMMGH